MHPTPLHPLCRPMGCTNLNAMEVLPQGQHCPEVRQSLESQDAFRRQGQLRRALPLPLVSQGKVLIGRTCNSQGSSHLTLPWAYVSASHQLTGGGPLSPKGW